MTQAFIKKTGTFLGMPTTRKWLFAEALLTSAYVKFTLIFLPFRKVAGWLGDTGNEQETIDLTPIETVKGVSSVLKLCDRYAPWPTECYTRALTGKIILSRRQIRSKLYFGFRKDEKGRIRGHAWLVCNDVLVTGFCDLSKFQVHSCFS